MNWLVLGQVGATLVVFAVAAAFLFEDPPPELAERYAKACACAGLVCMSIALIWGAPFHTFWSKP